MAFLLAGLMTFNPWLILLLLIAIVPAFLGSAGYYAAYIVMIMKTVDGALTIGTLTFLAGSFRQLRSLLESILSRFTSVSQGAIYLRDFFEFFEIEPKIKAALKPLPFPNPIKQGFTFEDVGFRYHNSDKWANRHLSFTLQAGEKLALVGENGAGKTTLVKLLARLYDPTEGRILLDGIDLREYDILQLRKHTGIIFQDYLRYQMSFAQNIAVGNIEEQHNRPLIETAAEKSLANLLAHKLPKASSSSWLPISINCPLSKTRIRSAMRTVEKR